MPRQDCDVPLCHPRQHRAKKWRGFHDFWKDSVIHVFGDVQAGLARHQKLAPDRGHGVGDCDLKSGIGQRLCSHQTSGACADDESRFHFGN